MDDYHVGMCRSGRRFVAPRPVNGLFLALAFLGACQKTDTLPPVPPIEDTSPAKPAPDNTKRPDVKRGIKGRTPVLTYHDFVERRDADALWFDCTPSEFTDQLDRLTAQGARFVSVEALERHVIEGRALPDGAVLLTVADNYLGFNRFALPALRKHKIPSVMFVHPGHVGGTTGRPQLSCDQLRGL